jgi:general stress protein YciG
MSDDKKDLKDGEHKAEASTDPRSTGASTPPESQTQAVSTDSDGRGFASMDGDKQREIASKGGKAAHEKGTAHEFTSEEAREAGRKGGQASQGGGEGGQGRGQAGRGGQGDQGERRGGQ